MTERTDEEVAASQNWKGMDGAIAYHLIDRHAEKWHEVAVMMNAWLEANGGAEIKSLREQLACAEQAQREAENHLSREIARIAMEDTQGAYKMRQELEAWREFGRHHGFQAGLVARQIVILQGEAGCS